MNNASPSAITHIEYETERSIIFKWKSRLFMCNVCVIPVPNAMKRAYSVWNNPNHGCRGEKLTKDT